MYAKNQLSESEILQQTPSSLGTSISDSWFFARDYLEADIMVFQKSNIPWNKGKEMSNDFKEKCKNRQIGKIHTKETKEKISKYKKSNLPVYIFKKGHQGYFKGKTLLKEHKKKIGNSLKGRKPWSYGKELSEETKEKIKEGQWVKIG